MNDQTRHPGHWLTASLLTLAVACVPACGDDDTSATGEDAGAGGTSSSGGSTSSGGKGSTGGAGSGGVASGGAASGGAASGGAASGGATSSGGAPEAGGDGGLDEDAGDAEGGPPALPSILLASGTDFRTRAAIATLDLARGVVLGEATFDDPDTIPVASDGRAFALERTRGVVNELTATGAIATSVSLQETDGGTEYLNPQGVVVIPGTSKAFVPLYQTSDVAVLDLTAGQVTSRVDLSSLARATDADGSIDVAGGVYDAKRGRVYFIAQRIDLTTPSVASGFAPVCEGATSQLVALDAATNAIVDLNGADDGVALPLHLVGASDTVLDQANDRLVLLAPGCAVVGASGSTRDLNGVETVALGTLAASVVYDSPNSDFLGSLLLPTPERALIQAYDADTFESRFFDYDFGASLGPQIAGVPSGARVARSDALFALRFVTADAAKTPQIVRYDLATSVVTPVLDFTWSTAFTSSGGIEIVQ